ncbi:MAG: redoxin domain-containing protein [Actinomycetota bacterium]
MTQLVELQNAVPAFAEAGIKLYAISYDEIGALEAFTEHHGITYDLLSDEGSAVIRTFGILNHHVTEEQVPYHGIPFPGTYLVDEHGVVAAKAFHASLAQRESAEGLIDSALGEILLRSEEPTVATADGDDITLSLTYHGGGGVMRGGSLRRLVVRIEMPEGLHVYDHPVPAGMVATTVTLLGPPGLRALPVEAPPTEPLELPGVGELQVWSNQVDFVMPVWATDEIASLVRSERPDSVTVEVEVAYQACDDEACRLPRTERLSVEVPVDRGVGPALARGGMPGTDVTTMDTPKWLGSMVRRGLESTDDPDAAVEYLTQISAAYDRGPLGTAHGASDPQP